MDDVAAAVAVAAVVVARPSVHHTHVITQIYSILRTYLEILPVQSIGEELNQLDDNFDFDLHQNENNDSHQSNLGPKKTGVELLTELPMQQSTLTSAPINAFNKIGKDKDKDKDVRNKKAVIKEKSQKEKNDKLKTVSNNGKITPENSEMKSTVSSLNGNLLPISTLLNTEIEVNSENSKTVKKNEIVNGEIIDHNLKSLLRTRDSETVKDENTISLPGILDIDSRINSRISSGSPLLIEECSSSATSSSSSSSTSCSEGLNKIGGLDDENKSMNLNMNVSNYSNIIDIEKVDNNDIDNDNIDIQNYDNNRKSTYSKFYDIKENNNLISNNKTNLTLITQSSPLKVNQIKSLNNNDEENNYVEVEVEEDITNFDLLVLPYRTLKNEEERIEIAIKNRKIENIYSFSTLLRRNKNCNRIQSNLNCGKNDDNTVRGNESLPYTGASSAYVLRNQMIKQVIFQFIIVKIFKTTAIMKLMIIIVIIIIIRRRIMMITMIIVIVMIIIIITMMKVTITIIIIIIDTITFPTLYPFLST